MKYEEVYPGIDLAYYGTQGGRVEFDGDLIRARHDAIVSDMLFNASRR